MFQQVSFWVLYEIYFKNITFWKKQYISKEFTLSLIYEIRCICVCVLNIYILYYMYLVYCIILKLTS